MHSVRYTGPSSAVLNEPRRTPLSNTSRYHVDQGSKEYFGGVDAAEE